MSAHNVGREPPDKEVATRLTTSGDWKAKGFGGLFGIHSATSMPIYEGLGTTVARGRCGQTRKAKQRIRAARGQDARFLSGMGVHALAAGLGATDEVAAQEIPACGRAARALRARMSASGMGESDERPVTCAAKFGTRTASAMPLGTCVSAGHAAHWVTCSGCSTSRRLLYRAGHYYFHYKYRNKCYTRNIAPETRPDLRKRCSGCCSKFQALFRALRNARSRGPPRSRASLIPTPPAT